MRARSAFGNREVIRQDYASAASGNLLIQKGSAGASASRDNNQGSAGASASRDNNHRIWITWEAR